MPPDANGFYVNPMSLSGAALALEKLASKIGDAKKYIEQYLEEIGTWEGGAANDLTSCWGIATSKVPEVKNAVGANLDSLQQLTTGSVSAIQQASALYQRIDLHHAQQIDGSYTPAAVPGYKLEHEGNADDPTATLREPKAEEKIPADMKTAMGILSWLSPSHLLDEGIKLVTGVNPGEWVAEKVGGDWKAFAKAGDAMRNLGAFFEAYADNIEQAKTWMLVGSHGDPEHEGWRGNAANAADIYFTNLALAVQSQGVALKDLAHQTDVAATGIAMTADGLKGLLESLSDALIGAALAAAAAAASSETIIGGIICGAAAGWEAYEAFSVWKKVGETVDLTISVANTFAGVIPGILGALHGLEDHPLPGGAYQAPVETK